MSVPSPISPLNKLGDIFFRITGPVSQKAIGDLPWKVFLMFIFWLPALWGLASLASMLFLTGYWIQGWKSILFYILSGLSLFLFLALLVRVIRDPINLIMLKVKGRKTAGKILGAREIISNWGPLNFRKYLVKFEYEVTDGTRIYTLEHRSLVDGGHKFRRSFRRGQTIKLRFHPSDPGRVLIEWE